MIKAILNGILNMLAHLTNIFLIPINAIFSTLFPDMTNAISNFNTFVNTYVGGSLAYFFSILPPIFRSVLALWFTFLISYYAVHFAYMSAVKIWGVLQKLKFW